MTGRTTDSQDVKPTRVVTLMTAISVATPFLLGGAGLVWSILTSQISKENAQAARDAARVETDKQVIEKLADLKANVQVLTSRMESKSDLDADQNASIKDLDRRVTRLEGRP